MGNWRMLFLGVILGSALTVAIVYCNPNAFGLVGGAALAAHGSDSHQRISAINDSVRPSDSTEALDNEPWGPFRTVDW